MMNAKFRVAVCAIVLIVPAMVALTPALANHESRVVWPYGLDERHVPVIAGFKIVPLPPQCGIGHVVGDDPLLETDFDEAEPVFTLEQARTFHPEDEDGNKLEEGNLWHVTDTEGRGSDHPEGDEDLLYFGISKDGHFDLDGERVAGAASFDVVLPDDGGPHYAGFGTKWEVEWLDGYDHMWVELEDEQGEVYILCTVNPEGRGDPSSNDEQTAGSCSPYHLTWCPNDDKPLNLFGSNPYMDDDAPHWEKRFAEIPDHFNGQDVKLRLTFDASDGVANQYLGWMVDSLVIADEVTVESEFPTLGPAYSPE